MMGVITPDIKTAITYLDLIAKDCGVVGMLLEAQPRQTTRPIHRKTK